VNLHEGNDSGLTAAFINMVNKAEGLQLGFLNIAKNGFLPAFPFFNFPQR
jgi:hypothetical protein